MKLKVDLIIIIKLGRTCTCTSIASIATLQLFGKDEAIQSLMGQVTYPVSGNATDETVLKELGVPDYDAAVVAVRSSHRDFQWIEQ